MERRIDRLKANMDRLEVRFTQQLSDQEARRNLKFEELGQQIRELSDRIGNLERGQPRQEGQPDIIRDAIFQQVPG